MSAYTIICHKENKMAIAVEVRYATEIQVLSIANYLKSSEGYFLVTVFDIKTDRIIKMIE